VEAELRLAGLLVGPVAGVAPVREDRADVLVKVHGSSGSPGRGEQNDTCEKEKDSHGGGGGRTEARAIGEKVIIPGGWRCRRADTLRNFHPLLVLRSYPFHPGARKCVCASRSCCLCLVWQEFSGRWPIIVPRQHRSRRNPTPRPSPRR